MPVFIEGWNEPIREGIELAWAAAVTFGLVAVVLGVALTLAVLTRR